MDPDEAAKLYLRRIEMKIPVFETMNENELNYVKMINAGQGFFYNNVSFNVSMPSCLVIMTSNTKRDPYPSAHVARNTLLTIYGSTSHIVSSSTSQTCT